MLFNRLREQVRVLLGQFYITSSDCVQTADGSVGVGLLELRNGRTFLNTTGPSFEHCLFVVPQQQTALQSLFNNFPTVRINARVCWTAPAM